MGGTSYDASGNLLNDTFHSYTWNVYGRPATIDGTTTLTYDAFDQMVEKNVSGVSSEVEYSPMGKACVMNGATQVQCYVPLPGGEILSPGPDTFWHTDWLGSARLGSSASGRTVSFDRAFAPFGETYNAITGGATNPEFAGMTQETISGEYDTPNRQYPPTQGRWISPDPAGAVAASLLNPQTWNLYSYVTNDPLNAADPTGLGAGSVLDDLQAGPYGPAPFLGGNCELDGLVAPCNIVDSALRSGGGAPCPDLNCTFTAEGLFHFQDPVSKYFYHPGMLSGTVYAWCAGPWSNPTHACLSTSIVYDLLSLNQLDGFLGVPTHWIRADPRNWFARKGAEVNNWMMNSPTMAKFGCVATPPGYMEGLKQDKAALQGQRRSPSDSSEGGGEAVGYGSKIFMPGYPDQRGARYAPFVDPANAKTANGYALGVEYAKHGIGCMSEQ